MRVREVQIGDEKYFVRKFTVREYRGAKFREDDPDGATDALIAIGTANEDGSRKYPPTVNDKGETVQVSPESAAAIADLPFEVLVKLAEGITKFNGLDTVEKK